MLASMISMGLKSGGPSTPLKQSTSQLKTIFALASAPGKAGIAVVRVSGPDVRRVYDALTPTPTHKQRRLPQERVMVNRSIVNPSTKEVIDRALLVYFAGLFWLLMRTHTLTHPPTHSSALVHLAGYTRTASAWRQRRRGGSAQRNRGYRRLQTS